MIRTLIFFKLKVECLILIVYTILNNKLKFSNALWLLIFVIYVDFSVNYV